TRQMSRGTFRIVDVVKIESRLLNIGLRQPGFVWAVWVACVIGCQHRGAHAHSNTLARHVHFVVRRLADDAVHAPTQGADFEIEPAVSDALGLSADRLQCECDAIKVKDSVHFLLLLCSRLVALFVADPSCYPGLFSLYIGV